MASHKANPDHFHLAVEHGLTLIAGGVGRAMLDIMARECDRRGLADASAGYMHAKLRLMAVNLP